MFDKLKIPETKGSNSCFFRIAELVYRVDLPIDYNEDDLLPSYLPFKTPAAHAHCSVRVVEGDGKFLLDEKEVTLHSDEAVEWADRFRFYETPEHFITCVADRNEDTPSYMYSTKDFATSIIFIPEDGLTKKSGILTWLFKMVFGQAIVRHDAVMVHASVVENNELAYAFLGKSGTGKSTHSRLWMAHLPNFRLLNDDNPIVRVFKEQGVVKVYGSPWSGKTPCYINKGVQLGGIVRLRQSGENIFDYTEDSVALLQLLPSCTAIRWNASVFNHMVAVLTEIIPRVPIGLLHCLPNEEAANLCHSKIKEKLKL